jgi:hypothetical protein
MISKQQFNQIKTLNDIGLSIGQISRHIGISYNRTYKQIQNIKLNKMPYFSIVNENFFEKIDTEEKIYWLGFIYADGNIYTSCNRRRFDMRLQKQDSEHLQKFATIFDRKIKYNSQLHQNGKIYDSVEVVIESPKIYDDLINCGIIERKTYEVTTSILNNIHDNLINHFIRGLFDGDGCLSDFGQFNICGNKDLLQKVQEILINNIQLEKTKITQITEYCYGLNYGGRNNIKKIYKFLYLNSSICLERKRNKFEKYLEVDKIYPDKISPPYFGITKTKDGKFKVSSSINGKKFYAGQYSTELEAAYYFDLEQVQQRGEEARKYMNFPSKYDDFIEYIEK